MNENPSAGRTGKSILGEFLRHFRQTVYLRHRINIIDPYVWKDVTEYTRLVVLDDMLPEFDFEDLFRSITGYWIVISEGSLGEVISFDHSPKIFIASNYPIASKNASYTDRQWKIWFSDHYEKCRPIDEFGRLFFLEWDTDQWNLAWSLTAQCVELYFEIGYYEKKGGAS
jgi:hypothetical protein